MATRRRTSERSDDPLQTGLNDAALQWERLLSQHDPERFARMSTDTKLTYLKKKLGRAMRGCTPKPTTGDEET